MLEQSELNSAVYYTKEAMEKGKMKLSNHAVALNTIKFGPPTPIVIHRKRETDMILLESPNNVYRLYDEKGMFVQELSVSENDIIDDELYPYLYGVAQVDGKLEPYLIRNEPTVSISDMPSYDHFKLPPVLGGYPYDITFSYSDELVALIGTLKATFTDRYKRPLMERAIDARKYYPISMDKVTTTFSQLANRNLHYPIVVMLTSDSGYACMDLEPGYSEDDLQIAESFDYYYSEDTPRGGKHYLVRIEDGLDVYKYEITKHLEVQVNCQITFYGINGTINNVDPNVSDFSEYKEVGKQSNISISMVMPEDVHEYVDKIREVNKHFNTGGAAAARRVYLVDKDASSADFNALLRLYRQDIKPYEKEIPTELLPWVLAEYATDIIPARIKHSDNRVGVPYLVYLASKITNYRRGSHD